MTALQELLAKVKAGNIDPKRSIPEFAVMFETFSAAQLPICVSAFRAYNGSLDAAVSLHEAVLPGWSWSTVTDAHNKQWFFVGDNVDYETDEIYHKISARALLIADIQALIAKEKSK